jgi:hypothetical protein
LPAPLLRYDRNGAARLHRRSAEKGVPVGTKTITMYVSDLDQSEIPAGEAYQISIRHPDGSTQQLDISAKNYRDLKLEGLGKTLKKRGRKPGSTTTARSTPRQRGTRRGGDAIAQGGGIPEQGGGIPGG